MELYGLGILLSHIRDLILEWEELPSVVRWFSTGLIILFIEYRFPTLLILWFALAAFVTSLVSIIIPEFQLLQIFVFTVSSYVFFNYRRELIKLLTPRDILGFFTHELVSKQGICSKTIRVGRSDGLLKISGIEWSALSHTVDIEKGEKVLVTGRKDHTLFIEPWDRDLAQKIKKHRHVIGRSFPITITSENKKGVVVKARNFTATTIAGGREIMKGEMVNIVAIGRRDVIVDLKEKDFLVPRDMIGKTGTACESFGKKVAIGSVKIDGVVWNSQSYLNLAIIKDEKIRVTGIDGLTLSVEAVEARTPTNN